MLYDMTSGNQFRASGTSWPPAAHQQTFFYNSTYGALSLFHDPSNPTGLYSAGGGLCSPGGPLFNVPNLSGTVTEMTQSNPLQRFMENPAVVQRPYFAPKLQFGLDVPSIIPSVPNPFVERGLSHLEFMTKSLLGSHASYTSGEKKSTQEGSCLSTAFKETKNFPDVVYIKSERSEVTREFEISSERSGDGGGSGGEITVSSRSSNQRAARTVAETGFKDGSRSLVTQKKPDRRKLEESETDETKYSIGSSASSDWNDNEKCNINVIDLSIKGSLTAKNKLSVKCESLEEVCTRLGDNKCLGEEREKTGETPSIAPDLPGCSRTSAVIAKRRHNPNPELPSVSIKNEPTNFHKCVPSSPPFTPTNPLPLSEIFHPSGLDLLDKCGSVYSSSGSEGTGGRALEHNFLNTRLNPCYFAQNLALGRQFSDGNRWTDKTFVNPFQLGGMSASSSTLLSPSTFDFSNPLGMKRESNVASATTSSTSSVESREQAFICSRQGPTNATDEIDFRLPPVGFEILRDPVTGKFLLIPAASIEALQRALFWPGYQPPALLPIGNNESVKNGIEATIKEEDCSVIVSPTPPPPPPPPLPKKENPEVRPQVTRNWLLEKAVKEEAAIQPSVDVSGLELLSRGIEKIERETEDKMSGLGLLCALAEQRMKDEITGTEEFEEEKEEEEEGEQDEKCDTEEELGKPKKMRTCRREMNFSPCLIKRQELSPPVLEKATDIPEKEEPKAGPPTLTPNTEDMKPLFVKCEVVTEEETIGDNNNNDEELRLKDVDSSSSGCRKRKLSIRSAAGKAKKQKLKPNNSLRRSGRKKKLDPSEYLFRPIYLDKLSGKAQESACVSESLSSFEIVRPEPTQSPSEKPRRTRTRSECKAIASDGEECENSTKTNGKRQGKIILKLRREKVRLSEPEAIKSCVLTTESLLTDKFPIRILTVDGGLFYTGQLSAIQPPDVYGITIDGERGNRPHIYSREEILNNSILEVKPTSTGDLKPGTRVCAYWSGQYRCLYPGSVATSVTPDPEPDSVNVEFDDGDSCRISVNDIRLLPEDYPIVEYDPNPLLSLAKKKRRMNMKTEEKMSEVKPNAKNEVLEVKAEPCSPTECVNVTTNSLSIKSEKKLLKKIKREKKRLLREHSSDVWTQKHHKKHKKHRHKHGRKHKSEEMGRSSEEISQDGETTTDSFGDCGSRRRKRKKGKKGDRSESGGGIQGRKLWGWSGKGFRRAGVKGKARKEYYKAIQRGDERIVIGECAVFLSTGRPDRPFIGRIESMWETWGANMVVRVKWFYHPEETVGCPAQLEYPGGLFESPHSDENDVQTISHKCEVLPLKRYIEKLGKGARNYEGSTTLFYLAGFYDPTNTSLQFQEGVK